MWRLGYIDSFFLSLIRSPSGPAQLLQPSVQWQTENRGMEGRREHRGRKENEEGEAVGRKEESVENERGPLDVLILI